MSEDPTTFDLVRMLRESRAETQRWLKFIERGFTNHAQFGLINPDGSTEKLPCADWCYACRVEKAEATIAVARSSHQKTCPLATGALNSAFTCSMCELLAEEYPEEVPDRHIVPWTASVVDALNLFQIRGRRDPVACELNHQTEKPILIARRDGWHCPGVRGGHCDFRWTWAPRYMTDPEELW